MKTIAQMSQKYNYASLEIRTPTKIVMDIHVKCKY